MARSTRDNTKIRKPRAPEKGTLVGVRLQADLLEALDALRLQQPDAPSRPEAIRQILAAALKR